MFCLLFACLLLVLAKIILQTTKFDYSGTYNRFKLAEHCAMLYNCWHPYKYVGTMIHASSSPYWSTLDRNFPPLMMRPCATQSYRTLRSNFVP